MTINLLPWRESLNARRRLLLIIVFSVTILGLIFTILACRALMSRTLGTWDAEIDMLHKKVARVKGLDRLIQPSQSSEDKLLNQVQMLGAGVNRSRMNDPHWMAWVRGALLRQQVTLKAWLVVQGQFDIHLQIDDPKVFSGLVAQVEEFSWQMVEFNTSGEVMNVVIRAPAVD